MGVSKSSLSESQWIVVKGLGLTDEDFQKIVTRFNELIEGGRGSSQAKSVVRLERFVIHMIQRDVDPLWADAAFRAFDADSDGGISLFEFLQAEVSVRLEEGLSTNETWLMLRRQVLFTVYDRDVRGWLGRKELHDLLEDMSTSGKAPVIFGIRNTLWSERQESNKNLIADEFSLESLTKELALSKMVIQS